MSVRVVVAPTVEPLSLVEAKLHLREDLDGQDDLISALITAAREYAEKFVGRAFVTQTLELSLDAFPPCEIEIPRPPLQWIESIKYIDIDGVEQTIDDAMYEVDIYREPGVVRPVTGEWWPTTKSVYNAVKVRYVAGYAEIGSPSVDPANAVPELVKRWMAVRVGQLYEHREAVITGTIVNPLPSDFVDGMLTPLRVRRFV